MGMGGGGFFPGIGIGSGVGVPVAGGIGVPVPGGIGLPIPGGIGLPIPGGIGLPIPGGIGLTIGSPPGGMGFGCGLAGGFTELPPGSPTGVVTNGSWHEARTARTSPSPVVPT